MMAAELAGFGVPIASRRREEPLPPPFTGRARVLPAKGVRQLDGTVARGDVRLMLGADLCDVPAQRREEGFGHKGASILPTLSVSNEDLAALEIDTLIRNFRASSNRIPPPYSKPPTTWYGPARLSSSARDSPRVSTTGRRAGRLA